MTQDLRRGMTFFILNLCWNKGNPELPFDEIMETETENALNFKSSLFTLADTLLQEDIAGAWTLRLREEHSSSLITRVPYCLCNQVLLSLYFIWFHGFKDLLPLELNRECEGRRASYSKRGAWELHCRRADFWRSLSIWSLSENNEVWSITRIWILGFWNHLKDHGWHRKYYFAEQPCLDLSTISCFYSYAIKISRQSIRGSKLYKDDTQFTETNIMFNFLQIYVQTHI